MNSKTLMSTSIVSLALSFAAMQSFALPSSLAHRWSFNTDDKDEITGAEPPNRFGTRSISDGKVHFLGNSWGGGSLHLGTGSLGSGDATVEIWASNDAARKNAVIFSYSDNGWGTGPTMEACMQWTSGTDVGKDGVWLSNNGDKLNQANTMAPYELGKEYHIAMTLHDNGDGTTAVYWQKRDAATGVLEKSGSGTAPGWTLSALTAKTATFAIGVWKTGIAKDAYASYNEVRVWNGVLGEEQLAANAFMGPDVMAPSTVVGAGTAGFALAPNATFRVAADFTTTGAVTLGEGSKLQFTEAATFTAGSFVLPAGTAIADYVDADAESFNVSTSGNTITVTRKSTVPATASWIGSGSVSDPANWDCRGADGFTISGVLPMASTAVTISGNVLNLQAPANSGLKAASIAIGACTLAADCDWRGFPVAPSLASGSVNLNGRKLYLPSLVGGSGAKFTGAGELHLDTPSGNTAAFADFDVTGRSVAKEGAGDLVVSGTMPVGNGGMFALEGGSAAISAWLAIGLGKDNSGSASVANGSLSVGDTLYVGYHGTGSFDVGAGGTVTSYPRLVANAGTMTVHDGGKIVTPKFQDDDTGRATSVVFDGGTLQATGDAGDFIKGFDDFTIGAGGMTVDAAGKTLGVAGTTFKITPGATPAITLANGGSLSLAGATFVLSSEPSESFVLAVAAPGSGSVFAGDLPALALADGRAYMGAAVLSADGTTITVVPVSGSVWSWSGATDSAFATAANWANDGIAASSLEGASLLLPAGISQSFTYVGWDPVVLASATFLVDGAASFGDVGGFYLKTVVVGATGRLVYDPAKFTFRLVKPPSFSDGAKIALAAKYAPNTKGRFLLMTWNEDTLAADAAALTAVFDASSAKGANPKVWAENFSGGGGRLWLDLDYGAAKQRVNVLCVGDSITHGYDGNELCGTGKSGGWGNWRTGLMKKLAAAGYEPVAKGHRWDQSHDICGATMPDEWISHAGAGGGRLWRGTIDQIENTLDQAGDVDFVLCKIGTNDMGAMDPAALYVVWENLVRKVLSQKPSAKFIAGAVVDIAYNPTLNNRVVAYNNLVRNAIANGTFPEKRVYFADLYTPCYRYDGDGNEIQGAFYDDTVNKLHPDWPSNDKIADTYFAAIANALADDPSFVPGQAEAGVPTTSGAENNVPAAHLAGYKRARVFDVAANNGVNLAARGRVPYEDIGETGAELRNIGRVGYYVELKRKDDALHQYHGLVRWLWVSMDAFGDGTIETMGVPLDVAKRYQGPVANLRVASNMPGVDSTAADAEGVAGWLEFWPSSYLGNAGGVAGAPGSTHGFDWNDACGGGASGYGSMQVHRLTPGKTNPAQVMFAFNRWTAASGNYEIGIGNFSHVSLGSVDWTFVSEKFGDSQRMSAAAYEAARIEVWTKKSSGPMLMIVR